MVKIPHLRVQTESRASVECFYFVHDGFHKRGFSATVLTYYTDLVPTFYNCIYLTERLVVAENELVQNNRFFNRFALGLEVGFESCRVKVARRADFAYTFDLFEFCLRHAALFALYLNLSTSALSLSISFLRIIESLSALSYACCFAP